MIGWTIARLLRRAADRRAAARGLGASAADDPANEVVSRGWVEWVVSQLDGNDGECSPVRYRDGLEPDEIAAELGMQRNAVDQALHRGRAKIRELLML